MRLRVRYVPAAVEEPLPSGEVLATVGLTAGTAIFPLVLPQGVATNGVQVGALDTQTDVKTTWQDGSIRLCVVSCDVPGTDDYDVTEGLATVGAMAAPTWPTAAVTFTIGATTWTATLPARTTVDPWLGPGPCVVEYRALVLPVDDEDTPHPSLEVVYDVRSYAAGGHRVDVRVQNLVDGAATDAVTYDVSITVNGSTVFTQADVIHYIFLFWRQVFLVGSPALSTVTHDFEPFHLAGALPRYLPTVANSTWVTTGSGADYDFGFMKWGRMKPYMMEPGGRAEIGPYPFWVAQYIVHKGASQREAILTHADFIGSWPLGVVMADGAIPKIGETVAQNYWLDGRGGTGGFNGPAIPRDFTGGLQGYPLDPNRPDAQHFPGVVFPAYLLTGDRFYADAMTFTANWVMLSTYTGDSKGYLGTSFDRTWEGVGRGLLTTQGDRGFGWALRELVHAAVYLPDADPNKQYFIDRLQDNLAWFGYYQTARSTEHPIDEFVLWDRGDGNLGPDYWFDLAIWKQSYLAWAIDLAHTQGFSTAASLWFRDQIIKTQVKFLTSTADGYPTEYGVPYVPRVAQRPGGIPGGNPVHYFADMGVVWNYNHGDDSGYPPENTTPGQRLPQPINGYYGPEARLLLEMGVRDGIPGADVAAAWLAAVAGHLDDVNGRSGFAVKVH